LLRAPQVLECAKGSQDGTTNPDGVLALRRSNDLDRYKSILRKTFKTHKKGIINTFMLEGDNEVSSFCIRSAIPGYMVVPPERTTLP